MRKILSRPRTAIVVGLVTMLTVVIAFAARPTAAPTRGVVLFTPLLAAGPGNGLLCEVVNVATTSRSISMDLVGNDGVLIGHMPAAGGSLIVNPGQSFGGGVIAQSSALIGYCRITVVDGTSSLDVRGEVVVNDATTAQTIAVASAF